MKKLRFAPSPTGFLHLGNARTALICYLLAKKDQGKFILRIDDTDVERCKPEFQEQLKQDLNWLGLQYDEIFWQSKRKEIYNPIIEKLKNEGYLYACYETKEELELKRNLQLKNKQPPIYDRQCLNFEKLSTEKRQLFKQRTPHWRFKLNHEKMISWHDGAKKNQITFDPKKLGDPIVIRENGIPTYLLISVIDDIEMQISDVLRGEDHISNTAAQIQMFEALHAKLPNFFHLPLIKSGGEKISKRVGGLEIKNLQNLEPMTINNYLFNLGQSKLHLCHDLNEMIQHFDIKNFSSAAPILSLEDLQATNQDFLKILPYEYVQKRLQISEKLWDLIKNNLDILQDAHKWQKIFSLDFQTTIHNPVIISVAREKLTDSANYAEWIEKISAELNNEFSKKEIMISLRLTFTGEKSGPKLPQIFEFLGQNEIKRRLS